MSRVMRLLAVLLCVVFVHSLPTMYKVNENRVFEKDLVPVSSTVIPLPIYKVTSNGYNAHLSEKSNKLKKPEGPVSLITSQNKKKAISDDKKTYPKATAPKY